MAEIKRLNSEITRLKAENARLNASVPGGAAAEEKSKALAEQAAALKRKEDQLSEREKAVRLDEERIRKLVVEIGEARQIKKDHEFTRKEYEDMKIAREKAEGLANRWLTAIAVFIAISVAGVIAAIIYGRNSRERGHRIDSTARIVRRMEDVDPRYKQDLLISLGKGDES